MTRIELMKAAVEFAMKESGTCGDREVDQERIANNLFKLLVEIHAAGVRRGEGKG